MLLLNTNRLNLLPVPYIDSEVNTFVRIIGVCLPDYMTSHPTRQQSSHHSYLVVLNVPHKCVFIDMVDCVWLHVQHVLNGFIHVSFCTDAFLSQTEYI